MSGCDIVVEIDREGRAYRPREVISGTVKVRVYDDVKTRGLTLQMGWRTRGRGNTVSKVRYRKVLFKGEWEPGFEYSYPFRLKSPRRVGRS